jgi:hypothetical protein
MAEVNEIFSDREVIEHIKKIIREVYSEDYPDEKKQGN